MPSAAPNLATLLDFEGQFETAAAGILTAIMVNAYATGEDQQIALEKSGISFDLGPALEGKFAQLPKPASWPANAPAPQEYFIYDASLTFEVGVPRDDQGTDVEGVTNKLSEIRGKLREVMMQSVRPFNEVNLPYYKVARIRPDGSSSQQGDKNRDTAFLRFSLRFEIRNTAWPAWVEE
jgi:hypothetical protein